MKRSEAITVIESEVGADLHPETLTEKAERILAALEKFGMLPPIEEGITIKLTEHDGQLYIPAWSWQAEEEEWMLLI